MKVKIDRSSVTFLALCECGWRGDPRLSHGEALQEAIAHENRAHPGHSHAAQALHAYVKRNG